MNERLNEVRRILDVYDKARENLSDVEGIQIPTIVAIGDQSSGKSSVMESISQINLPKGAGCVTCAPLVLKLRNRTDFDSKADYATIRSEANAEAEPKRIENLDDIEQEIRDISDILTSKKKSGCDEKKTKIVDIPIHLTVYRKNQVDLTLVDLPGLYYGDQEITKKIKGMYNTYIENPNSVILYTMPCTNDLDTGEAFAIARQVDPLGKRTLTVVTKIDKRDEHFNEKLKTMSDGLGVVCVRNRTNQELNDGVDFEAVRQIEKAIFNLELTQVPEKSRGVDSLISQLVELQRKMVLNYRFKFKEDLQKALKEQQYTIHRLPKPCDSDVEKHAVFKKSLNSFQKELEALSTGNYNSVETKNHFKLRARVDEELKQHVEDCNSKFDKFHEKEFEEEVEKFVNDKSGAFFPNHLDIQKAWKYVEAHFAEVKDISEDLLDEITQLCLKIVTHLVDTHFHRFEQVKDLIQQKVDEKFSDIHQLTKSELIKMVKIEQCSIQLSTDSQPEYERFFELQTAKKQENGAESSASISNFKVNQIKNSLLSYAQIASDRFIDQFHMWILYNYVTDFMEDLPTILDEQYSPNAGTELGIQVKDYMKDPVIIKMNRCKAEKAITKIQKSLADLDNINSPPQQFATPGNYGNYL